MKPVFLGVVASLGALGLLLASMVFFLANERIGPGDSLSGGAKLGILLPPTLWTAFWVRGFRGRLLVSVAAWLALLAYTGVPYLFSEQTLDPDIEHLAIAAVVIHLPALVRVLFGRGNPVAQEHA